MLRPRFVPDRDLSDTRVHIPKSTVRYSDLHSTLKAIIGPDITEHELLEMIVITVNKMVMHLMAGSDEDITEDDISWP